MPNFVVDDFEVSYGDPQTVQVNARRDLGAITLRYRVNGGKVQKKSTSEWGGGLRYGDEGDYWYHRMRGQVTGTDPGDSVEVWFTSKKGNRKSSSFTYEVRSDLERGRARARRGGLQREQRAAAVRVHHGAELPPVLHRCPGGHPARRVRLRRQGRKAPDPLGVLSHFDAVIWYTGNDNVTRRPNAGRGGPGGASHHHRCVIS